MALLLTLVILQLQTALVHTQLNALSIFEYNWKPPGSAQYVCPSGWTMRGPNCYKAFTEALSWGDAKGVCKSFGGQLAKIETTPLNVDIGNIVSDVGSITNYWIGLTVDAATDPSALWADDTVTDVAVGRWSIGQPDSTKGKCTRVVLDASKYYPWSMEWCSETLPFVCQSSACLNNQYLCLTGLCIAKSWKCDGKDDCGDGSDERDCSTGDENDYLSQKSGELKSKNYPSSYSASKTKMWTIQGPIGSKLQLEFDGFNTEEDLDIVDVWVGGATLDTSQHALTLSGRLLDEDLPTIISTNNLMIVTFDTDDSKEKSGFTANWNTDFKCEMKYLDGYMQVEPLLDTWTSQSEDQCKTTCLGRIDCNAFTFDKEERKCLALKETYVPTKDTCCKFWAKTCPGIANTASVPTLPNGGGELRASTDYQRLSSPFYPFQYLSNMKISWVITSSPWTIITIQKLFIDLAEGDIVTIHDGDKATDVEIGRYSGSDDEQGDNQMLQFVMTTDRAAYISVDTVSQTPGRGYQFAYKMGCHVEIVASTGIIQSPSYGKKEYPTLQTCTWKIRPPTDGQAILLSFVAEDDFGIKKKKVPTATLR